VPGAELLASARAAGDDDDVGGWNVMEREVDRQSEKAVVGTYRADIRADEFDLGIGQSLQYLVGSDRIEGGDLFEEWDRDFHQFPAASAGSWIGHPVGLKTRSVDGGAWARWSAGRIGRGTRLPPQFLQTSCISEAQVAQ